jgi:hypothetical protein
MSEKKRNGRENGGRVSRRGALAAAGAAAVAAVAAGNVSAGDKGERAGTFDPNKLTFADCVERVRKAAGEGGLEKGKIVTSHDRGVKKALESLQCKNLPGGFKKYQLPIFFDGGPGAHFFVSVGHPEASVPRHSHNEGDALRYIISGSIVYDGKELSAGDWMFLPKGAPYSFTVGKHGVMMFYCYQCCCK